MCVCVCVCVRACIMRVSECNFLTYIVHIVQVDPLYKKTSAAFDEGGIEGLLLNQIHPEDDLLSLKLDPSLGPSTVSTAPCGVAIQKMHLAGTYVLVIIPKSMQVVVPACAYIHILGTLKKRVVFAHISYVMQLCSTYKYTSLTGKMPPHIA